jgi:hypothetical protein
MSSKEDVLTLEEARDLLEIDDTNLDFEIATHSVLVDRVEEQYFKAVDRRDTVKKNLKKLEAEISMRIRGKSKGERISDATLAKMVLLDEEYDEMQDRYLKACRKVGLWEAKKDSYKDRTFMLAKACDREIAGVKVNRAVKSKNAEDVHYETTRQRLREMNESRVIKSKDDEEE